MKRPVAPPATWEAPSRLRRRTAATRLRSLRSRPAVGHTTSQDALTPSERAQAVKPPKALVQAGAALMAAYVVYTAVNVLTPGAPLWAGTFLTAVATVWFGAVMISDLVRWKHYDALQRTKAILVWAAVLVLALAV